MTSIEYEGIIMEMQDDLERHIITAADGEGEVIEMPGFLKKYSAFYQIGRDGLIQAYERAIAYLRESATLQKKLPVPNLEYWFGKVTGMADHYSVPICTVPDAVIAEQD